MNLDFYDLPFFDFHFVVACEPPCIFWLCPAGQCLAFHTFCYFWEKEQGYVNNFKKKMKCSAKFHQKLLEVNR